MYSSCTPTIGSASSSCTSSHLLPTPLHLMFHYNPCFSDPGSLTIPEINTNNFCAINSTTNNDKLSRYYNVPLTIPAMSSSVGENINCICEFQRREMRCPLGSLPHATVTSNVSQQEGLNENIFYSKMLPVKLQFQNNSSMTFLHFTVILKKSSIGLMEVFKVELTKADDPYFLHTLELTEKDFLFVKSEQRLVVDFENFPSKFVELLEGCQRSNGNYFHSQIFCEENNELQNCFMCLLNIEGTDSTLLITERNKFKEFTHIYLKLMSGGDEYIKKHLVKQLQCYRAENEIMRNNLKIHEDLSKKLSSEMQAEKNLQESFKLKLKETYDDKLLEIKKEKDKEMENMTKLVKEIECKYEMATANLCLL